MDALAKRGCEHYNAGNYALAVQCFSDALEIHPSNLRLLSRRAAAYQKLSKLSMASADYHSIIKQNPESSNGYILAAKFFLSVSKPEKASSILTTGLRRVHDDQGKESLQQLINKCANEILSNASTSVANKLPHEILWYILEFSNMNTRLNAGLVCREWRSVLLSSPSLWQSVVFDYDKEPTKNFVQKRLNIYQQNSRHGLSSIVIRHSHNTFFNDLLSHTYPRLREFGFIVTNGVLYRSENLVESFLANHLQLSKIEIQYTYMSYGLYEILSKFPQLECLILTKVIVTLPVNESDTPSPQTQPISHSLRILALKDFALTDFNVLTNTSKKKIWLHNLESVSLVQCYMNFSDIFYPPSTDQPVKLARLSSLYIGGHLDDVQLDQFFRGPHPTHSRYDMPILDTLRVDHVFITSSFLGYISFNNLKSITLNYSEIRPEFLSALGDAAPKLEEFTTCRSLLKKSVLWAQIRKWPNLKTLQYPSSYEIINTDIELLSRIAPRLESLNISGCINVSGVAVVRLVRDRLSSSTLSRIKKLDIEYISDIDLETVNWLRANVLSFSHRYENPDSYLKNRTKRGRVTATA